jgi:hypothetical protein
VEHPVGRGGEGRRPFDQAAERASNLASFPLFLGICWNAEKRAEHAIQYKLDAIAQALLEMRRDTDDGVEKDPLSATGGVRARCSAGTTTCWPVAAKMLRRCVTPT